MSSDLRDTDQRITDRRRAQRRATEQAYHLQELVVVTAATSWRHAEAGAKRTAAALRLRDAVDRLIELEARHATADESGAARFPGILWGLVASGATLLFWYGPGHFLAIVGTWVGAGALAAIAWRHWHTTETFAEHVYSDCPRCNRIPIDCRTARRLASKERG